MRVPIIMPQLGESIAEATIINIGVGVGDAVAADQEIMEVETNKALLQVTAPCGGSVLELAAEPQGTYEVGAVLGYIETSNEEAQRLGLSPEFTGDYSSNGAANGAAASAPPEAELASDDALVSAPPTVPAPIAAGSLPVPVALTGAGYFSPRIKARLTELGLTAADLAAVAGTGAGGRVTVKDFESYLDGIESRSLQPAPALRVAVADSMRRSWSRPLATVGRPVDLDPLLAHRKACADLKPGVGLYVLRALALALAEDSSAANRLVGKRVAVPASIDIGFAVEIEGGLIVPVVRGADRLPWAELCETYTRLIAAARRRQLPPEANGEAIATVTNFGAFGLTWATPIPLPDQTLMLGLGAARKAPQWDEAKGSFLPVTQAEMTLSFDHRMLDGGSAGRLMEHITRLLAAPDKF